MEVSKNKLDANLFAQMVRGGAQNLNQSKSIVNDLNVFPVPDGDTGDNMFMTINSGSHAVNEIKENDSLENISEKIAKGMLMGARGNSGVILSRIFAGIARGFIGALNTDVKGFAKALEVGVKEAYDAVSVPVEGTILTVYKDAVLYANSRLDSTSDLESYFVDFLSELKNSLERTPELLSVLKEAGVVDSGGAGFVYIAEGMKKVLDGEQIEEVHEAQNSAVKTLDLSKFNENSVLEYGYCTEFLLQLQNSKVDPNTFDANTINDYLTSVGGNSIVCFKDGTIVKVHVHTEHPGVILNEMQKYGEFLTLKIENMTLQHSDSKVENRYENKKIVKHKKFAVVTVAAGSGIKKTFLDMGVDKVVDGGQCMNPSAEDFIKAFDEINAEYILVYPNNGNIVLTANQAASLYKNAKIVVIPTHSIGEGYGAISQLDTSSNDIEVIKENAKEIISSVKNGLVSRAIRDTNKDGFEVKNGDYIGFNGDTILSDANDANDACFDLVTKMDAKNFDILLLIKGSSVDKETASNLVNRFKNEFKMTEVILIEGEQPVYDYIVVLE